MRPERSCLAVEPVPVVMVVGRAIFPVLAKLLSPCVASLIVAVSA